MKKYLLISMFAIANMSMLNAMPISPLSRCESYPPGCPSKQILPNTNPNVILHGCNLNASLPSKCILTTTRGIADCPAKRGDTALCLYMCKEGTDRPGKWLVKGSIGGYWCVPQSYR